MNAQRSIDAPARRLARGRRRTRSVVGLTVAGTTLLALATPTAAADPAAARLDAVEATACRTDGLDWTAQLVLDVPAGSTVEQRYRVRDDSGWFDLGSVTTPVSARVAATAAIDEPQHFGPAWSGALPFTFEVRTDVHTAGATTSQVVQATCTAVGADATVVVLDDGGEVVEHDDEGGGAPAPTGPPGATAVLVTPRFTG